ncbi:MAG TPA: hypothetical protein VE978_09720 [Chitinophagales bacterium]|nr:hypothetical protein [Chitinophagales bacterium]
MKIASCTSIIFLGTLSSCNTSADRNIVQVKVDTPKVVEPGLKADTSIYIPDWKTLTDSIRYWHDVHIEPISKVATTNYTLDWKILSDTASYSITYIQLNFLNGPTDDKTFGKDICDFQSGKEGKKMKLSSKQEYQLSKLVTNPSNFLDADCGTFQLNAGFIIFKEGKLVGKINIGCGYNQWFFSPYNHQSKAGWLSKKGFGIMEKLLDDINLANK